MRTKAMSRIAALVVAMVMVVPTGMLFAAPALANPARVASGGPPDISHPPHPWCGAVRNHWVCRKDKHHSGESALEKCGVGFLEAVAFGGIAAVIAGPWGFGIIRVAFGAGVADCVKSVLT
jgi:hypothetical protein